MIRKKKLSDALMSSNNIELMRNSIPLATMEKNGLMFSHLARKSFVTGDKDPRQTVKILSLPLYAIFYGIISWGDYTGDSFNVAMIYCNNRSLPKTSITMLQSNGKLYYKYEGSNLNLYAVLEPNRYSRVDYIPFYDTIDYARIAVVEKVDIDESQLTELQS